jgi:hypothetical protein
MSTEIKPRKLKVVFCVTDCATGKTVAGNLPVDGDDMFQQVVEFPFVGTERYSGDDRTWYISSCCSSYADALGKKIASTLTSLILGGGEACTMNERSLPDTSTWVSVLRSYMTKMTDDERLTLIHAVAEGYCTYCGCKELNGRPCQCWNDE